jgi:hypothetical protein
MEVTTVKRANTKKNQEKLALREYRLEVEKFQKFLNTPPKESEIFEHPHAKGYKYLPISYVQMLLDEAFFGQWTTENFKVQIAGNEIIGSIELKVLNPITNAWITRLGAAASLIRQDKDTPANAKCDLNYKIKNALEMDFPHLYADCLKSAAKTLGKAFGRDLNRKYTDYYTPLTHETVEREKNGTASVHEDYLAELEACPNSDAVHALDELRTEISKNPHWRKALTEKLRSFKNG